MRKVIQFALVLAGSAAAMIGVYNNDGGIAAIGGIAFLVGGVMWIASPTRPQNLDGGNRPTHDPINQTGHSSDSD